MLVPRLLKILFVILCAFTGFCTGMFITSLFIDKTNGLAGPAEALLYGIAGSVTGFTAGIFSVRRMKPKVFRFALAIVIFISAGLTVWIIYRVQSLSKKQTGFHFNHQHTNSFFTHAALIEKEVSLPTGLGMAKPHLSHGKLIYFYHLNPIGMQPYQIRPVDSILIHKTASHFEISYAPPWFFPEVMKLDYDLLLFRTITVSKYWMEIVVNKQTGITYWISRDDAEFIDWANFLLDVFDVELIDPETNPLRLKPLNHAGIVATTPERFSLKPLAINGDWMMVPTLGLADRIVPYGWIRWRKDDVLRIKYSLLS